MKTSVIRPDICTEGDIKMLVDTAFTKANDDELLAPLCWAVARVHWPRHLTSLYDYWSSALLGTSRHHEGQFVPLHSVLAAHSLQSVRWAALIERTLEEKFAGRHTEVAKRKAAALTTGFCAS